jgi:class 3 adenylate cyclase/CHASE2 domain-containing sensor protein
VTELPAAPSTRRSLAARLPGPLGRVAESFRRAIERGDPRLGLLVGIPIALVVSVAFSSHHPLAQRADNFVLDWTFRLRPRIRESERILNVDMDDGSIRELGVIKRRHQAEVLAALDRLGARQIVYDVEFKEFVPRTGQYNEETGEVNLDDEDRAFRGAIARARRVTLGYHFDLQDPGGALLDRYPRLKEAISHEVSMGGDELARRSGVPVSVFKEDLELLRSRAEAEIASERLAGNPGLTFTEFRTSLLPSFSPKIHAGELRHLQHAYSVARATIKLECTYPPLRVESPVLHPGRGRAITPPILSFLEPASGGGAANAEADADGVLRRPWCYLLRENRPHFYLGFVAGIQALAESGEHLQIVQRRGEVEIAVLGSEGLRKSISIPVDDEGRMLVNWAGNSSLRRDWFSHLPFVQALSFYEERYSHLDENTRKVIGQLDEDDQKALDAAGYRVASDRLKEILGGASEKTSGEMHALESKLDAVRGRIMEAMQRDITDSDAAIPKLMAAGKEQLAKRTKEARDRRQADLDAFRVPYVREVELRKMVEGRICFIGAAYTGSGDLHSTSLGIRTPGVDVHANIANMILTNQVIRRGKEWGDFVYVVTVGLFVSLAVTYWGAMSSAFASLAMVGGAFGVYWWAFTSRSILISGAGPILVAVLTFAGAIAFKELVTLRSKRKLQRELEKNTSPEMVKIIMEHPEFISKPRKVAGTFLFSDVKSFTSISEKMTPDVLFPFINRMLDAMTQALKRHQAYIDKYVGDGVVALFGMPVVSPDHARNACLAALDCQAALKKLNEEFAQEGLPEVMVRIGVNSGDVKAGNMGAADRSSYTVMGDPVNLASRLEGANKSYDTYIMIGESTLDLVQGQFLVRELDRIRVVGKKLPVRVFELIGAAGEIPPFDPRFLELYASALGLYQARRWQESIEAFERALKIKPGDKPCTNYVSRASEFLLNPPPADWEGVFELHSK